MAQSRRTRIVICYHAKDRKWLKQLKAMLAPMVRKGTLDLWDDSRITSGAHRMNAIEEAVENAEAAVLLVSPDLLAAETIFEQQLRPLLAASRRRRLRLFWILVRGCLYEQLDLNEFQAAHDISAPLSTVSRDRVDTIIADICRKIAKESAPSASLAPRDVGHNLPPLNPWFTGRSRILNSIRQQLERSRRAGHTPRVALMGLGGSGKTQIALEFAWRKQQAYRAVLWIPAGTEAELRASLLNIVDLLNLKIAESASEDEQLRQIGSALELRDDLLLVFDSADSPELLHRFLPARLRSDLLLTSRAQVFQQLGISSPLEVPGLLPDEALSFLLKRTGRKKPATDELTAARDLAAALGYLPLALEQAAAYLVAKNHRFDAYLREYRAYPLKMLQSSKPVAGDYHKSVLKTWEINFQEVTLESSAAADLLRLSAFLSPDAIPLELFSISSAEVGGALASALRGASENPLLIDDVLTVLTRYSLITLNINKRVFNIHRLVQEVIRALMTPKLRRTWAERAVHAIASAFPFGEFDTWFRCERLLPHAREIADLIARQRIDLRASVRLLNHVGQYLKQTGRYSESERLYRQAINIWARLPGANPADVAATLNNLGTLLYDVGRHDDAAVMYRKALELREGMSGADRLPLSISLTGLGLIHKNSGQYELAEPLLRRALELRELGGKETVQVAQSLSNLGALYSEMERFDEAETLYRRALELREKLLEPIHPEIAKSVNNLGELFFALGRLEDAKPLCFRALEIWERTLDQDHPQIVNALSNCETLLRSMGRDHEADSYETRRREILSRRAARGEGY